MYQFNKSHLHLLQTGMQNSRRENEGYFGPMWTKQRHVKLNMERNTLYMPKSTCIVLIYL